jgi:hypothetical protein
MEAIAHAMTVLDWHELPKGDRPREEIWLDDEAISAHFEMLAEQREAQSRGEELIPDEDMAQNELTAQFKR